MRAEGDDTGARIQADAADQANTTADIVDFKDFDYPENHSWAGYYEAWYDVPFERKDEVFMVIGCDYSATMAFKVNDFLHSIEETHDHPCKQSDIDTYNVKWFIRNAHGQGKYECLFEDETGLIGWHFLPNGEYYCKVHYIKKQRWLCGKPLYGTYEVRMNGVPFQKPPMTQALAFTFGCDHHIVFNQGQLQWFEGTGTMNYLIGNAAIDHLCNDPFSRGSTWSWWSGPTQTDPKRYHACLHMLEDKSLAGLQYTDGNPGAYIQYIHTMSWGGSCEKIRQVTDYQFPPRRRRRRNPPRSFLDIVKGVVGKLADIGKPIFDVAKTIIKFGKGR